MARIFRKTWKILHEDSKCFFSAIAYEDWIGGLRVRKIKFKDKEGLQSFIF